LHPQASVGLVIPLYLYPGPQWKYLMEVKKANPSVPIVTIINPANGPGDHVDPSYVEGIDSLRSVGITVLGYLYTSYGERPTRGVISDIGKYSRWYHVDGLMFDEMSNFLWHMDYYSSLNDYAHSFGYKITFGNPGIGIPSNFVGTMDIICIYESAGFPQMPTVSRQRTGYQRSNFAMISYDVKIWDPDFVHEAANHVGWIYVTDANLPNPYEKLPSYLAKEFSTIASNNHSSILPASELLLGQMI
jgi:hypothetical protein